MLILVDLTKKMLNQIIQEKKETSTKNLTLCLSVNIWVFSVVLCKY